MNSTAAFNGWEAYLKGLTPCRFPRFSRPANDTTNGPRQVASARVSVEQADRLLSLSTTDPEELSAVLRTAWALLLRCYTGQDDVSFSFQHGGDVAGEPIVARFLLEDSATVADTVGRAKTDLAGDLPPVPTRLIRSGDSGQLLVDTAVVLWSFTKTSAPCRILEPVCLFLHPTLTLLRQRPMIKIVTPELTLTLIHRL